MVNLKEIYDSVESPLENNEILEKIVSAYSKSSRTNLFGSSDLYSSLVKMNQTKDNTGIKLDDKEKFLVEAYNQWIDNMLNLNDSQLSKLEQQKGMEAKAIKQYLQNFGKVRTMEDITRLTSNPLFEKEVNGWEVIDGWEHIKSQYISARQEKRISVKHRLYVGCQNQDMWKLAKLFKNKCEEQQIPFYFKLGSSRDRDDKMVIYSDTENLANYISVLQEIAQEHSDIMERCGQPPILTGTINNWIGIGDEPPIKANGDNQSYNSLRADIFESAIEETLLTSIKEFKGKDVVFNGKRIKFNDLFIEQAARTIIERLDSNKEKKSAALSKYGLKDVDLTNVKFKEYIKKHLRKNIQSGLNKLDEVKDKKGTLLSSNDTAIFSIPTRNDKRVDVNTYDMDKIIKDMIPIMKQIDPAFMSKVKSQIISKCKQAGIDDNFCFQQGSKERFEQADAKQPKTNQDTQKQENAPVKPQIEQKEENQSNNTGQQKYKGDISKLLFENTRANDGTVISRGKQISVVDIVDTLNPTLMQKKVNLPNGKQISAKQYIQEFVAPYIPRNGKFILKSNGLELSAQQFIEEAVMYVGQEKYNGDIRTLIDELTVANNGTIEIGIPSKDTRGQALQQEMGIEKPKQERVQIEKDEDEKEPDRRIKMSSVVDTISKGKVTTSETQSAVEDMKRLNEVKRLMFYKRMGKQLTKEQEMLIQNHIRQANEAQVRFQNQQYHRKANGLEM